MNTHTRSHWWTQVSFYLILSLIIFFFFFFYLIGVPGYFRCKGCVAANFISVIIIIIIIIIIFIKDYLLRDDLRLI